MTPIELRHKVRDVKRDFGQGKATIDDVHAAIDNYIAALKSYKKASKKKFRIPSRAYLARVL